MLILCLANQISNCIIKRLEKGIFLTHLSYNLGIYWGMGLALTVTVGRLYGCTHKKEILQNRDFSRAGAVLRSAA